MAAEKAHEKRNKELLRQANKSRRTSQAAVQRSLENASIKYNKMKRQDDTIKQLESDIRTTELKIRTANREAFGTENYSQIQNKVNSKRRNFGSVRNDYEAGRVATDSKEKRELEKQLQELNEKLTKAKAEKSETVRYYSGRRR